MKNIVSRLIKKASPRQFCGDRKGIAAVEFALLAPVMVFIFFAVVEGSDALSTSRRVAQAVNTLTDLAAQETQLSQADIDDLFDGVEQIIDKGNIVATMRLVSVVTNPDGDILVHWSRDNAGATPYAPGADYTGITDATLIDVNASIMVAEIEYDYTPTLTGYLINSIAFRKMSTRWPRRALRVQFCTSPGVCTT